MTIETDEITINENTTAEFYIGPIPGFENARVGGWLNVGAGNRAGNNAQLWFSNVVARLSAASEAILSVFNGPSVKLTTDAIQLKGPVKLPIEGETGMATLTVKRVNGSLKLDISE